MKNTKTVLKNITAAYYDLLVIDAGGATRSNEQDKLLTKVIVQLGSVGSLLSDLVDSLKNTK